MPSDIKSHGDSHRLKLNIVIKNSLKIDSHHMKSEKTHKGCFLTALIISHYYVKNRIPLQNNNRVNNE